MKVPLIDLTKTNARVKKRFLDGAASIIDSSSFIDEAVVKEFERAFADSCGAKHCIAVNSGTSALHLALKVCASENQQIVTAPNSFFATAEAISYVSKNIVFEDVGEDANLIIPENRQYKACVPVSLYGNPCDFDEIAKRSGLIIHDACQAHGAKYKGKSIASFAKATCFSFYPTKNLGAFGEGGAIVTDDGSLAQEIRELKAHGQRARYVHHRLGYNYRMDEMQALALLLKTEYLEEDISERKTTYERYKRNLAGSHVKFLPIAPHNSPVHHLMPVFVEDRVKYIGKMEKAEIQYGHHYPILITEQQPFAGEWSKMFPKAQSLCDSQISLPMFIGITNEQIDYVCETLL